MGNIKVTYDGEYPSTCKGRLTIIEDGMTIYSEEFCCHSTGSVWFDDDWNEHVEAGELVWNDEESSKFPEHIRDAVKEVLSECRVCCGGCI